MPNDDHLHKITDKNLREANIHTILQIKSCRVLLATNFVSIYAKFMEIILQSIGQTRRIQVSQYYHV